MKKVLHFNRLIAVFALLVSSAIATQLSAQETLCSDGLDNDNDGWIDCADINCAASIVSVALVQPTACPAANNGSITINVLGGATPLEYSINGGTSYQASGTFSSLSAGTYDVRVRAGGATGCVTTYKKVTLYSSCPVDVCVETGTSTFSIPAVVGATAYNWTVDGGTAAIGSGQNTPQIQVNLSALSIGLHTICVNCGDMCGTTGSSCFSINVIECGPNAVDDTYSGTEDTPLIGTTVGVNDTDPNNNINPTGYALVTPPSVTGIAFTFNPNGTFNYTPPLNFNGPVTFEYRVCDLSSPTPLCDTATVTLNIAPVNDPPVAVDDSGVTPEDTPITLNVPSNDTDIDGTIDFGTVTITTAPTNGIITSVSPTGAVLYTPNAGYTGTDVFSYQICDDGSPVLCDIAQVTITIQAVNDPPIVTVTPQVTPEDTPIGPVCFPITDETPDNHTVAICGVTNGTATASVNNGTDQVCINFTPTANYNGPASVCLTVCDNGSPVLCTTVNVPITVTPVNDPPIAVDDIAATPEDTPLSASAAQNDNITDGPTAIFSTTATDPVLVSEGTLVFNNDGSYVFTPATNFIGTVTFTYQICDGATTSLCDEGIVTIVVGSENDPPVVTVTPQITPEDTPIGPVCFPITDEAVDNHTVSICGVTNGTATASVNNGTDQVCINFTPTANYNGPASICLTVCDNGSPVLCTTVNVPITVTPVNDPPIAIDDLFAGSEDTPLNGNIAPNDNTTDGPTSTFSTTATDPVLAGEGTLTFNSDGSFVFTPALNFNGTVTFTYQICDGAAPNLCDEGVATLVIAPVNDAPVVTVTPQTTNEDTPMGPTCLAITDESADNHTVVICGTTNGSATATVNDATDQVCINFTPTANYNGPATVCLTVCDNGTPSECVNVLVPITVTPVNDPIDAINDVASTNEDTPVTIPVTSNDDAGIDGSLNCPAALTVVTPPTAAQGTATVSGCDIIFTPAPNFSGPVTFTYQICDNGIPMPAQCDIATVTVTVNPVNEAPVANDDTNTTPEDTPVVTDILSNDTDLEGLDPTSVTITGAPSNGTVTVNPITGAATYTPNPNFNGTDVFYYEVCDLGDVPTNTANILCDQASVTITVTPVNDPIDAINDVASTNEDTPVTIPVTSNDSPGVDGSLNCPAALTVVTPPTAAQGTATVSGCNIVFTPASNFNGTVTFTYQICDNGIPMPAQCDIATVTVTVNPVNEAPVANDDTNTTPEDVAVTTNILSNDTDLEGLDPTSVTITGAPANGTVTVNPITGAATYTPNPNFNGTDVFYYEVCDLGDVPTNLTNVLCDQASVTITVTPVNDPIDAINDVASTNEDTPVTIPVTSNDDAGIDGSLNCPAALTVVTPPTAAQGTATVSGCDIIFTPAPNFSGPVTFTYQICDNGIPMPAQCDIATVTVTVNPVNEAPVANDDTNTTPEDTPVVTDILSNDTDLEGLDPTSVTITGAPSNGTVTVNPITGAATYTPNPNFNGTDVFYYEVCDLGDVPTNLTNVLCDQASVTITVTPVNDPIDAINDVASTNEDTPVTIPVTSNDDAGIDGSLNCPAALTVVTPPTAAQGTATVSGCDIIFTPAPNFSGLVTFTYQICDNGIPMPAQCDIATVTVTVNPVNEAPVANDDTNTTPEDTPVVTDILSNDTDLEGLDPTSVTITGAPANGTVTVNPITGAATYTPNPNFNGTDVFYYEVCDLGDVPTNTANVLCDQASVTITVTPVNDPIDAINDVASTNEDTPVTIPVTSNDSPGVDGALNCPAALTIVTTPIVAQGTATVSGCDIIFTPAPNFNGPVTFTYQICDNGIPMPAQCDIATVTVTVNPVNEAPVANDDTNTTPEDTPVVTDILSNDTDLEGLDPTSVTITGAPANGTVTVNPITGAATYTPNPNFNGTDVFYYEVCDLGDVPTNTANILCDQASVTITVTPVNDPIDAINDVASTNEDTPVTIPVTSNDDAGIDGSLNCPAALTVVTPPTAAQGTATVSGCDIIFTPAPNFSGPVTFTYQICDNGIPMPAQCDIATVTVTVNPVNEAPVANDDTNTTPEDTPVVTDILSNDTDLEGLNPTSVTITGAPANGTVTVNPITGAATYTPNPNFNGTDVFYYEVCDLGDVPTNTANVLCDQASVTITVTPVNDPIDAINDVVSTNEDTPVTIPVTSNDDAGIDGSLNCPAALTVVTPPTAAQGTATVSGCDIIFTPAPNFSGPVTFTYQICDNGIPMPAQCDIATVTVTVNPVNEAPVANDDTNTTPEDTPILTDILANDTDLEGLNPASVTITTQPINGTVAVNSITGAVIYTPNPNYNGVDSFNYEVCDLGDVPTNLTNVLCDQATVIITVTPVNDPIDAINDVASTNEDTPVTIPVTSNDDAGIDGSLNCPAALTVVTPPTVAQGTATVSGCNIIFTPAPNFNGTVTFTYQICDNGIPMPAQCDIATVTVTVNPVNEAPVANDDTNTTPEDTPVVTDILSNDTDLEGLDPTSVTITGAPANGTVTVNPITGAATYTPNPNFNGTDVFYYEVCDLGDVPTNLTNVLCDQASVTITVTPVNDPIDAINDVASTNEDTPVTIPVTSNDDAGIDGSLNCPAALTVVTPPTAAQGTATVSGCDIIFTPAPNFNGTVTFTYQICDNGIPMPAQCDIATVTVTVNPVNEAPVANDDTNTTPEDTPVVTDILSNDTDLEGLDPTSVTITGAPANGTVTVNPITGAATYTPNPNFNGTDVFYYEVCDLGDVPTNTANILCDQASVTITVTPVNDPIDAINDVVSTNEDTPVTIPVTSNDDAGIDGSLNCPAALTVVTPPTVAQGTATVSGCDIIFTPAPNFNGTVTFTYQICDNGIPMPAQCDIATVTVTVNPVNEAPVANDDTNTTPEDTPILTDILANDTDLEGLNPASVTITTQPINGTVAVNSITGAVIYTPNPNYNGVDSFNYEVCDLGDVPTNLTNVLCDQATVIITVTPVNDPIDAINDVVSTNEDTPVTIPVTSNDDAGIDGSLNCPAALTVVTPPTAAQGTATVSGCDIIFTPAPNFNGPVTFTYQICDNGIPMPAQCDIATVTVTVNPVNEAPVANDDTNTTPEDTPVVTDILSNDTDLEGLDPTSVTITGAPANGTVTVNPITGAATYTPNPNFNGTDVFYYEVCDLGDVPTNTANILCDQASVTITVTPVNDPIDAINDVASTNEDTPVTIPVTSNDDAGIDGSLNCPAALTVVTPPTAAQGTATVSGCDIIFTPAPNFNGTVTFTYQICDNGIPMPAQCDIATVTVTVNPVNEAPVANDDTNTTPEDTPILTDILANDTDLEGLNPASVTITTQPINGTVAVNSITGAVIYTPNPNYNGVDSFNYEVCDLGDVPTNLSNVLCDQATVVITVTPVNDPIDAINDVVSTNEDTPVTIPVTSNDDAGIDGSLNCPAALTVVTPPTAAQGTATVSGCNIIFTPAPNFNGTVTFTYQICDNGIPMPAQCDIATVTVTVNPVNEAPVANDDTNTTPEDTPILTDILANDTDLEGLNPASVTITTQPINGTVAVNSITGAVIYTPNPNYNGVDSFNYEVCDLGDVPTNLSNVLCDQATVVITVTPVNDPIDAINDVVSTNEDTPVTIPVTSNDDAGIDGSLNCPAALTVVTPPTAAQGTATVSGCNIIFTPAPNFNGTVTFTYQICDNGIPMPAQCDIATVTVTVNPVNEAPVANDDTNTTPEDTPILTDILANDTDLEGLNPASVTITTQPINGTVAVNSITGAVIYTPNPNYNGVDSFNYEVCDLGDVPTNLTNVLCDQATVVITVTPVNDPIDAINDVASTNEDTPVTIPVTSNDSPGVDGSLNCPAALTVVTPPTAAQGTATVSGCNIVFTPASNFNGTVTFTYQICDNGIPMPAQCDIATVTVTVNPVNEAPVANDDTNTTPEDTPILTDILANDTDLEGLNPASVTITTQPINGTVAVNSITGAVIYTPNPNYNGVDSFNYEVCDLGDVPTNLSNVLCDQATVVITVTPVNDPIDAINDVASTNEDTPVTIPVTSNDDAGIDGSLNCPAALTVVTPPTVAQGTATVSGCNIIFTPAPNFNGTVTFTYQICDNGIPMPAQCDIATVTVTVNPVNEAPVANDDTNTTPEDTPILTDILANDTDLEGLNPASVTITTQPINGTVAVNSITGAVIYTPNPNYNGVDSFNYEVCDLGDVPTNLSNVLCDQATVVITVTPVNDPIDAINDVVSTNEDTPVTIPVTSNDDAGIDGSLNCPAALTVVTPPTAAQGTATVSGCNIIFTPAPNFNGTVTFTYQICDNGIPMPAQCDIATVTVTVLPGNDPIIANLDTDTTPEETPIAIQVPNNDTDIDNNIDVSSVIITSLPSNGTVVVGPGGVIVYTPDNEFNGLDTFIYQICDAGLIPISCDTALVIINVTPTNDAPIAVDDYAVTVENTPVSGNVLPNDTDIDNDPLTVTQFVVNGTTYPAGTTATITGVGTIVINTDGSYTFTPLTNYVGSIPSVDYTLSDGQGGIDVGQLNIDVLDCPDPIITPSAATTFCQGDSITLDAGFGYETYIWNTGATTQTINVTSSNTYRVTVSNLAGCVGTTSILVVVNPNPTVVLSNNSHECMDPTEDIILTATPSGGTAPYTYYFTGFGNGGVPNMQITTNDPNLVLPNTINSYSGTYNVYVVDENGCQSLMDTTAVDATVAPQQPIISGTHATCEGNPIVLSVPQYTGNTVTYEWLQNGVSLGSSNNEYAVNDATQLSGGNYQIVITVDGCVSDTSPVFNVTVHPRPEIVSIAGSGTYCSGDTITLVPTINVSVAGAAMTYTWTTPSGALINQSTPNLILNSSTTANLSGLYTLVVHTPYGCDSESLGVNVQFTPRPVTPSITSNNSPICQGEALIINTTPYTGTNVSYIWNTPNGQVTTTIPQLTITNAQTTDNGLYSVAVNVNGCISLPSATTTAVIGSGPVFTMGTNSPTNTFCFDEEILFTSTFNFGWSYQWTGPNAFTSSNFNPSIASANMSSAGVYNLLVMNNQTGCTASSSITVTVNPVPTPPTVGNNGPVCEGTDVELFITGGGLTGATYEWHNQIDNSIVGTSTLANGQVTLSNLSAGDYDYYVIMSNSQGCAALQNPVTHVHVDSIPNILPVAGDDMNVCTDVQVFLHGLDLSLGTGEWHSPTSGPQIAEPFDNNSFVSNLQYGQNIFVWTASNGACTDYAFDTMVVFREEPSIANDDNFSVAVNESIIDGDVTINDYLGTNWQTSMITPPGLGIATMNTDGTFDFEPFDHVIGLDSFSYSICNINCPDICDTATVHLTIGDVDGCFIVNTFTPNGDNINDQFVIPCALQYPGSELIIYNRWGDEIYHSTDYHNDWEGTYHGNPVPSGTYFWLFNVNKDGATPQSGYITILR